MNAWGLRTPEAVQALQSVPEPGTLAGTSTGTGPGTMKRAKYIAKCMSLI
ncbi:MAG: PEP-CTERM sorting domain-containing protein [Marinobacter sp.]